MAASESLSNGATADSGPLKPTETNGRFLELPEHMKQVASSSSLAPSEYSDRDELNWSSRSSVEQDRTDLAIIEGCVEDLALAPIHLQELLTDDFEAIFPTSPVGSQVGEKEGLRTPTSPRTPSAEGQRTLVQKYLLWGRLSGPFLVFTLIGLLLILIARSHLMQILNLLERLPWFESCVIFIFLFTLVSFPFGIGYIVLNMMAGYLYGFLHGQLVVMVSVAVGFTISFFLCRIWFREYAKRIVTSNALQAIMRVVEGKNGVKVIILTRLTPIPFGLQNVLFSVSGYIILLVHVKVHMYYTLSRFCSACRMCMCMYLYIDEVNRFL